MKTLLVIGGTGFFGKSILDAFARGLLNPWNVKHVTIISRHVNLLIETAPQLLSQNVTLFSADITTTETLPKADYVIHAAASTDVRNYVSQSVQEELNIIEGINNYCSLAKKFHIKSKIVYVSSGAVYGEQPLYIDKLEELYLPGRLSAMEASKHGYAIAKSAAELAMIQLGNDGLNVSIARCFAFVGCWLPRDQHFAIGNFIEDALNHRAIKVKAKHKVYRSYMYADDLVEWLMSIVSASNPTCPIWNVGSQESILIEDLAKIIGFNYGVGSTACHYISDKIDRYVPSTEKIQRELGVVMKNNLITSITKTIDAIKNNS
jgi:dTDP-glucose 4,6-dehydratase